MSQTKSQRQTRGRPKSPRSRPNAPTEKQHDSARKGAIKSTVAKAAEKKSAKGKAKESMAKGREPAVAGPPRSRTEVFATGGGPLAQSAYLGRDDLDGLPLASSKGPVAAIVIGTLVVVGLAAYVITSTAVGEDIPGRGHRAVPGEEGRRQRRRRRRRSSGRRRRSCQSMAP